ncbi:hypothetical protein BHM03_00009650 [Ensete ventricosum]|nr:hypothetical protein BHM03_00009650 [Ensete ventricosum]
MILPVVKLGTLVLKTVCKPIANRLKKEAGLHPKFRQLIINLAQVFKFPFPRVAGAGLIFEVQRSARSEARKEEIRRQEIEVITEIFIRKYKIYVDLKVDWAVFCCLTKMCFFCSWKAMKQKEEELVREVEQLKQKLSEIERLAKGRGLSGFLNFRHGQALEGIKSSE